MTDGLLVFVQLVMAEITTEPWVKVYSTLSNTNGTVTVCFSEGIA